MHWLMLTIKILYYYMIYYIILYYIMTLVYACIYVSYTNLHINKMYSMQAAWMHL